MPGLGGVGDTVYIRSVLALSCSGVPSFEIMSIVSGMFGLGLWL